MAVNNSTISGLGSITIPSGVSSVDATLTLSTGDATSISIAGVFTVTIKSKSGTNPQTVTFTLGLKAGTPRPGQASPSVVVTAGGATVTSGPIAITY